MKKPKYSVTLILSGIIFLVSACAPKPEYDTIIINGFVLDGTGNPWFYADIGIKGDEIAAMGNLKNASSVRTIDATGLYVAPGFIDPHSHAEGGLISPGLSHGRPLLAQGVTTVIVNQCGGGAVDLKSQCDKLLENGLGINVGQLIPHGSVRKRVMGDDNREATPEELEGMKLIVREAMEYGALGLSTGLYYVPGFYAPTWEVIELSRIVAEYGGVHQSHIRDESNMTVGLLTSVEEIIKISEGSGITGIISHIKANTPQAWGASNEVVKNICEARKRGIEIFTDQYPYEASSTDIISILVPAWAREGGLAEMRKRLEEPGLREKIVAETRISLVNNGGESTIQFRRFSNDPSVEGKTLEEVALERNLDPTDLVIELISVGNPLVVSFSMHEDDIALFMSQSWNMTSSDGGLVEIGEGVPHPRNYGTFPRKIRKYALEENLLEIENAVKSMTSLTSSVFGLFKRGILRPGFKADIAIFDPGKITDKGTYSNPHQLAEGMVYVFVNGSLALDNFEFTDQFAGKVLHLGQ